MFKKIAVVALLCFLLSMLAWPEVADSGANGFTIKITTSIHAPSMNVYGKLVHNIGDWWDSQHTFSGNAHNLSIEERAGGCFCEIVGLGLCATWKLCSLRRGKCCAWPVG